MGFQIFGFWQAGRVVAREVDGGGEETVHREKICGSRLRRQRARPLDVVVSGVV